jgi:hypothetical protein
LPVLSSRYGREQTNESDNNNGVTLSTQKPCERVKEKTAEQECSLEVVIYKSRVWYRGVQLTLEKSWYDWYYLSLVFTLDKTIRESQRAELIEPKRR